MPKFTVWRSGSGHVNCWNALPVFCGEYDAKTFIDACKLASAHFDKERWTFYVVNGIMYIESDIRNEYGQKLGRYGFFQTQQDAMLETLNRFSTPQMITDSSGYTVLADVALSPNEITIHYLL